jgi:dephospho-CoA kinase
MDDLIFEPDGLMNRADKHCLKLGVTGGIGSGKTSVCKVFTVLGIPVFSTDRIAREIMDSDENIIRQINTIAGRDLYSNGCLDRMSLASLIFNNNTLLAPYIIMEAAILFESGASKLVDKIATIVAPVEERLIRVTQRSKLSRHQVLERMMNQMDDDTRIKLSDYVIYNSENDMIIPAILEIHEDILKKLKDFS